MVTIEKILEEHLTCVICSDVFTNPSTLECDHTFCRHCLLRYTKTRPDAVEVDCLPCAVCRGLTKVTSPDKPLPEWVNQVKPNQKITNLKSVFGLSGKESGTCSVCRSSGEVTPATAWCSNCDAAFCYKCSSFHRKMPLSRDHEVQSYEEAKVKVKHNRKCLTHTDEGISHFCSDCIAAVCAKCKSVYHSQCKDVLVIEDMTPGVTGKSTISRLDTIEREKDRNRQSNCRLSYADEVAKKEQEIRNTFQQTRNAISEMEKIHVCKSNKIREEQTQLLTGQIDSEETVIQDLTQKVKVIDEALASGCRKQMFDLYGSLDVEDSFKMEDTDPVNPKIPRFKPTWLDLKKTINQVEIGDGLPMRGNPANQHAVLHDFLDVKHRNDQVNPSLVDIVVVDCNNKKQVLVTDNNNVSIKVVFKEGDRQFLSNLTLCEPPLCVAKYDNNHVVVTALSARIYKVCIIPLSVVSTISTKHQYFGVASLGQGKLAVSTTNKGHFFRSSSSIDIIDISGVVLVSVTSRALPSPAFLGTFSNGNILVSDSKTKSVSLVSVQRKKRVFTYKPNRPRALVFPRGVAAGLKKDIYVVERDSNKVVQLRSTGEYVRDVLTSDDGLEAPAGVCVVDHDEVEDFLYVTSGEYIKVFKVK